MSLNVESGLCIQQCLSNLSREDNKIFSEDVPSRERYFSVAYLGQGPVETLHRAYAVIGDQGTTLETVWVSQKCFFAPGTKVKITDDNGNSKIFIA